jgi:two-component system response regulator YesN
MSAEVSVLLVDDEPIVRRGLNALLSRIPGFSVVGEAGNGQEAVELCARLLPQIIILDVRMPVMDGLSALRRIKERHPNVKTIILSAYSEFAYARSALGLGAIDYLLKPANLEDFRKVLERVRGLISEEARRSDDVEAIRQQLDSNLEAFAESFYHRLLRNEILPEDLEERTSFLKIKEGRAYVLLVSLDDSFKYTNGEGRESLSGLLAALKKDVRRGVGKLVEKPAAVFPHEDSGVVVVVPGSPDARAARAGCFLVSHVKASLNCPVSVGIGSSQPLASLSRSLGEARNLLKQRLVYGGSQVFDRMRTESKGDFAYPENLEREVLRGVQYGDPGIVATAVSELFVTLQKEHIHTSGWYQVCHDLYEQCYRFLKGFSDKAFDEVNILDDMHRLNQLSSVDELRQWLLDRLRQFARNIRDKTSGPSLVIRKVITLIERNYGQDISLASAAAEVGLNPNYLSTLFKSETGASFLEHLTQFRLEQAKRLLASSTMNVSQIAYAVGYDSPRYFSTLFARREGTTPSRFRRGERRA